MRLQLVKRPGQPAFLDLPWNQPLETWQSERIVEIAAGIHRHVVRFVNYDGALYALKELPERLARREYRLLRELDDLGIPVVQVVGVVTDRPAAVRGEEPDAILITRHLDFSLPYRTLFTGHGVPDLRERLLDALAQLLTRLHLAKFFWGDCSLSNTLFRRDAGALAAYLVDAETGELKTQLSDHMRHYDLDVAVENVAGELMDVQAGYGVLSDVDAIETALELRRRYDYLWSELTREETFARDEGYRIDARLRRLNDLGFDVDEVELITDGDGYKLRVRTNVVEPGHQRRRLLEMTGLDVQENQARRLLNDIARYRAQLEGTAGKPLPEAVVAYRWLREIYEPSIALIPADMREKLEPAEVFHQLLEHRWFLSEAAGTDVGLRDAAQDYVASVLSTIPDERLLVEDEPLALPAPEPMPAADSGS